MSLPLDELRGPYDCVFDVGAFRGDFAKACLERWKGCRVVSFEPLEPDPGGRLNVWKWFPVALGDWVGRSVINECEFIPSSSFLPMGDLHKQAFPFTKGHKQREVSVRRLVDFADIVVGKALLKIDVQGYELRVLGGAFNKETGQNALARFESVVLEVSWAPLYEGLPSFSALNDFLMWYGFEHACRVAEMPHPKTREILQSDELWVKT